MFGRKKYPPVVGTNTPEVRHFRRQLRNIEALTEVRDGLALEPEAVHRTGHEQMARIEAEARPIAERLFVSENTVKTHAGRLFDKLAARRRTEAVQRAREAGLIP